MWIIGINTGTSADAVDAALFSFNQSVPVWVSGVSVPIIQPIRKQIMQAVNNPNASWLSLHDLGAKLCQIYAEATKKLLIKSNLNPSQVELIGLHGQTIFHSPEHASPFSLQLDHGAQLAKLIGVNVVSGFRLTDIANGGQGAPLITAYHRFLASKMGLQRAAFINLGGIANISWIDKKKQSYVGYDVGPANALMDAWIMRHKQQAYDHEGQWAASGLVSRELLERLKQDPYFLMKGRKSTGRDYFSLAWLDQYLSHSKIKPEDVQATLCELTIDLLTEALSKLAPDDESVTAYLYGKGYRNQYLIENLEGRLKPFMRLTLIPELMSHPDWLECGLFAWLGYCYSCDMPIDLTSVTGAKQASILGCMHKGLVKSIAPMRYEAELV